MTVCDEMKPEMYFPVLKWKNGEQNALKYLDEEIKPFICPILETRNFSPEESSFFSEVELAWRDQWFILDVANPSGFLNADKEHFLRQAVERNKRTNYRKLLFCVWSTMLEHLDNDLRKELLSLPQPLCVRMVTTQSSLDSDLAALEDCYKELNLNPQSVILLVDFKENVVTSPEGQNKLIAKLNSKSVKSHQRVVLLSGAFPSKVLKMTQTPKRHDLISWLNIVDKIQGHNIEYGDYGCLSPRWEEKKEDGDKKPGFAVPPVVAFTKLNSWTAIRSNASQTPEACQLVIDEDEFNRCCWGCATMKARGDKSHNKLGNFETHLSESMNHHFTTVIKRNLELL